MMPPPLNTWWTMTVIEVYGLPANAVMRARCIWTDNVFVVDANLMPFGRVRW